MTEPSACDPGEAPKRNGLLAPASWRRGNRQARKWIAGGLLMLWLLALPGTASTQPTMPEVIEIRFGAQGAATRVVIEIDRQVEPDLSVLIDPPRLVLDLPEVRWLLQPGPLTQPRGLATGHRFGRLQPGRSRLVVDVNRPFRVAAKFWLPPLVAGKGWRYVVDLEAETTAAAASLPEPDRVPPVPTPRPEIPTPPAVPERTVAERLAPDRTVAPAQPLSSERSGTERSSVERSGAERPSAERIRGERAVTAALPSTRLPPAPAPTNAPPGKPLIAIDAGHGGVDPGAIGTGGVREKDLVLQMAFELRDVLLASGRYDVVLTRTTDVFLPLRERMRIAREANAMLFVSLHADSLPDTAVHGASVYTLSETASDEEAAKLAARENKVDILAGTDLTHHDPVVAGILIDLAQRDTNNKSIEVADLLVDELEDVTKLLRNNRRFAGFAVLKSPETPSVLVELGYLSNAIDTKRLTEPAHRRSLAFAILRAVDRHFAGGR